MNFDVEGLLRMNLVPQRRGGKEGVSPGTTDLSTEVREVRCNFGCEGADVGEDLRWEFVDGCERVSDRSDGTGSINQTVLDADDLRRRVS